MKKNIVATVAEDILNGLIGNEDWAGPTGKCWCDKLQRYVDPNVDSKSICKECPECEAMFTTDERTFRYLHLHDDYKSFGS
jgi:hypothetical protein